MPARTLDTTPHNVITSPPMSSNTGFKVSYNWTMVSQSEAKSVLSFSHIGLTYPKNFASAFPMFVYAAFMHVQIAVNIFLTVAQIFSPFFSQNLCMDLTASMTMSLTTPHTFLAILHTFLNTVLTTVPIACKAFTTADITFSPFFSHHAFMLSTAERITDFIRSQIFVTALRNPSLVFHKYVITPTTAAIMPMTSPTLLNSIDPTFIIVPTLPMSLPTTRRSGPIAAANNAIVTMFFFVPIDNPIIFAVSGEMYFCMKFRIMGMSTSPNEMAISSTSDFRIFICPCNVLS